MPREQRSFVKGRPQGAPQGKGGSSPHRVVLTTRPQGQESCTKAVHGGQGPG